jgi:lipopolysaccharide transport system permease protein
MEEKWDLIIKPKRSLFDIHLKELYRYRDLLFMFVKKDIVTVYKQTILGPVWYILQPILQMITFIIIFTKVTHLSTDGVPPSLFYLAGIVIWNYFSECLNQTANTFSENADMFGKVYFPRLITPMSKVISGLIKFSIQFALFLAIYFYFVITSDKLSLPGWNILFLPLLLIFMAGLGLGFGLIFSALTTKYKDLKFLLHFGIQLVMYATPVIYPLSSIPEKYKIYFFMNPLTHVIEAFKHIFLGVGEINIMGIAYTSVFVSLLLLFGVLIFNKTEKSFMDTV